MSAPQDGVVEFDDGSVWLVHSESLSPEENAANAAKAKAEVMRRHALTGENVQVLVRVRRATDRIEGERR